MDIIADANFALLDRTFARHGRIRRVPGREISRRHLREADVLLLRSVTRANAELLQDTAIRFVGTATIGTDHLDIPYLESRGIHWASAPGCNADAASQYALAMAWLACRRSGRDLRDLSVGIIGRGNVGSRLQKLLTALGVESVACDPPLQDAGVQGLVDLDTTLRQPVVSLHVPMTREGPYPTWHMLGAEPLAQMPRGGILVNTSRGEVPDGEALLSAVQSGRLHAALDVWPAEPRPDPALMEAAIVATPHVAGYSLEGKQNGSMMIYRAFCDWQGIELAVEAEPDNDGCEIHIEHPHDVIDGLLAQCCGVASDDLSLRQAYLRDTGERTGVFDQLRKSYRLRRDFAAWVVHGAPAGDAPALRALGFRLAGS